MFYAVVVDIIIQYLSEFEFLDWISKEKNIKKITGIT